MHLHCNRVLQGPLRSRIFPERLAGMKFQKRELFWLVNWGGAALPDLHTPKGGVQCTTVQRLTQLSFTATAAVQR